jgi:DNA-binding transcriptional LysR family regulator
VLRTRKLRGRTLQVIAAAKHPEIRGAISVEQYTRYPHVCYSPVASGGSSVEDLVQARLARAGLQRSIALHLPSILAMPAVVGATDLLATIATDVAQALAPLFGLQLLAPPLPLGAADLSMYWHERTHNNAGCRWLRQVIVEIAMDRRSICAQRLRPAPSIKSPTG